MQLTASSLTASLLRISAFAFALLLMTETRISAATWDGNSGMDDLWSTAGNWVSTPPAGQPVEFNATDSQGSIGTANNVVGTSLSITTLSYTQGVGQWHHTGISSGQTLTATGFSAGVGASATNVALSGLGTLSVLNSAGTIQVGTLDGSAALVNMSGLATFSASLGVTGRLNVGASVGFTATNSTLILAVNSTVTTGSINLGEYGNVSSAPGQQTLSLGSGINELNANTINVGASGGSVASNTSRGSGLLNFYDLNNGTVKIRGFAGGDTRADMNLTNGTTFGSSVITNVVNFDGHSADLKLNNLVLANRTTSQSVTGNLTSTFSFDTGELDVTSILMAGRATSGTDATTVTAVLNLGSTGSTGTSLIGGITMTNNTRSTGAALATINIEGGSHTVEGNVTISPTAAGGTSTSTLNLTGGTFTVEGNIAEGTGAGTQNSTIHLTGGTLDMDGGSITVDTFNVQSGTLRNLGEFNSGATLTKTTGGTVTLEGTNTYTGNTTVSGGNLVVTGSIASAGTYSVVSGTKLQVGNNTATGSLGSGTIANDGIVELNRNNALSFTNAISGAGNVVQNGSGVTTFSATHSYTGSTQVNVGTLLVNGSISSSSGVTVAAGATLGGSGSVSALSGAGTIAPGNSPGILTAPSVDGSGGLDFVFELTTLAPVYANASASLNDVLRLTAGTPFVASLNSNNTVTVDFSSLSLAGGQTYYGGFYADSGDFWSSISGANFVFTGTNGFSIAVSTTQQNADFGSGTVGGWVTQFDVLTIPEPSTTLLLTGGLMALVLFRRRRSY